MRTYAVYNLGCSKNTVDGERVANRLSVMGFRAVDDFDEAEIIVVNTCAFIREAKEEAISSILSAAEYKKSARCRTLVVAGCFSQRYRSDVAEKFPEVDLWTGVESWPEELETYFGLKAKSATFHRELSQPRATQYLKIAEGCSHGCSFCVIPSIRGKHHSRKIDDIVSEAHWLEQQGVKECILVSQDTSWYGKDIGESLTSLAERLLRDTNFPWIRTMYLHPGYVTDNFLSLVSSQERMCSYFDIPLQHISDPILTAMGRIPSSEKVYDLVERIRSRVPDSAIRTSFILGFPHETEKDFGKLLEFVEWARFDRVGVFPYSAEEDTRAADMRPRPKASTANRRCGELMELHREISAETAAEKIGRSIRVIVDEVSDERPDSLEARTQWDAPEVDGRAFLPREIAEIGDMPLVRITDADEYDFFCRPAE